MITQLYRENKNEPKENVDFTDFSIIKCENNQCFHFKTTTLLQPSAFPFDKQQLVLQY